jgi:hypothetical protein
MAEFLVIAGVWLFFVMVLELVYCWVYGPWRSLKKARQYRAYKQGKFKKSKTNNLRRDENAI